MDVDQTSDDDAPSLYDILGIETTAQAKDVKKAYYKLAMKYHPDRNPGDEACVSKFQEILKAYTILYDAEKRKLYDDTGCTDEDGLPGDRTYDEWYDYWRNMFAQITVKDIEAFEQKYRGSDMELEDLREAYTEAEGDFDVILELVPCCTVDDEERFRGILAPLIEDGELPHFKAFDTPDKKKQKRRRQKAQREAQEAEEMLKEMGAEPGQSLESLILSKRGGGKENKSKHEEQMSGIADAMMAKYCGEEVGASKGKRTSKKGRKVETEPSEDEFAALQAKMFAGQDKKASSSRGKKKAVASDEPSEEEFAALQAKILGRKRR